MHEQWWLHCTSQWGWNMLLSEPVYWVAIAFKMTEWGQQQISIKFCVKLEHSSAGTIWMIQKPKIGSFLTIMYSLIQPISCSFSQNIRWVGDSSPLQPRFGNLRLLAFPKTRITFEGEEISDRSWDSGKYDGQLMVIGRSMWGPKVPTLKGTEASLSYVQCFLYLVSSSVSVSIFIFHGWIPSGQALYMCVYVYTLYTYIFSWQRNHFMLLLICAHFSLGRLVLHGTKWKQ